MARRARCCRYYTRRDLTMRRTILHPDNHEVPVKIQASPILRIPPQNPELQAIKSTKEPNLEPKDDASLEISETMSEGSMGHLSPGNIMIYRKGADQP